MKLKKILAATLTTSMLFSGIAFTGVGVTEVQAVNGESQTARQIAGTNIANNDGIVAYSGHTGDFGSGYLMDRGGNNENNDNERWLSGVSLKNGTVPTGNTSYIVYDLGENGPRSYEGIKLRFHNKAFATKYKIYTSDTNNYDNSQTQITPENAGWKLIDSFERTNYTANTTFPLDELGKQTGLERYILFCFTDMNLKGGVTVSNQISIREIEIYHQAITSFELSETEKNMTVKTTEPLEVTIAPDNATYKDVVWSVETIGRVEGTEGDVVSVDAEGQVTANCPGRARVTATAKDDATKTASCVVTVQESKGDLNLAIAEASKLLQEDYTANSWGVFAEALEGAKTVRDDIYATSDVIEDAINALMEAQNALERVYKVTVTNNGESEIKSCEVGEQVTVVAAQAPEGQKFSHWAVDGKAICYKESYTFTVYKDTRVEAVYIEASKPVEKTVNVLCNVFYENGMVKFVSKHSVPTNAGYKVLKVGVVATDQIGYNKIEAAGSELTLNTTETTRLKKYGMATNSFLANYTKYLKTSAPNTWYARGYVTYQDEEGVEHTEYSELSSYTIK